MKKIAAIIILCFLPFGAYALTDQEVLDLLSQSSKEIEKFPFHVYVAPGYGGFHGTALPISSYGFFEPFYEELKYEQPDEIFSTYQFSQGHRWKCFLLRVPNMYDSNGISLWVFDRQQASWQEPLKIAEWWGDAGYIVLMSKPG